MMKHHSRFRAEAPFWLGSIFWAAASIAALLAALFMGAHWLIVAALVVHAVLACGFLGLMWFVRNDLGDTDRRGQ